MRPSNREQRRTEIVTAMIAVLATDGYANATISKIAAKANLSSGLVHYHFKNKQEILLGAIEHLSARFFEQLKTDPNTFARAEEMLSISLSQSETADQIVTAAWVAIAAESIRQDEVREKFEAVCDDFVNALSVALSARLEPTRAREIAGDLTARVFGYFVLSAVHAAAIPSGSAWVRVKESLDLLAQ